MTGILPPAFTQFFDANGTPLAAGTVWFYIPGTDTPATTYQDSALTIANPNPVILDAAGRAAIWGNGSFRQLVFDSAGNQIFDAVTAA